MRLVLFFVVPDKGEPAATVKSHLLIVVSHCRQVQRSADVLIVSLQKLQINAKFMLPIFDLVINIDYNGTQPAWRPGQASIMGTFDYYLGYSATFRQLTRIGFQIDVSSHQERLT